MDPFLHTVIISPHLLHMKHTGLTLHKCGGGRRGIGPRAFKIVQCFNGIYVVRPGPKGYIPGHVSPSGEGG